MYRGGGVLEALHGSLPEWLLLLAALVTRLGDVWVLIAITIAASWLLAWRRADSDAGRRPRADSTADPAGGDDPAVWLVGIVVGGLAAMTALKYLFALPRPDLVAATPTLLPTALESAYVSSVTIGGYAFPSGHAVGSTVAYGSLALALRTGTRRARLAAAAVVVFAVSLSRVVLAVHYPGDVVAGVAVGVAYLAGAWWVLERSPLDRPTTAFGLAIGVALVAVVVSGSAGRSVTYAALGAGALAAWSVGRPRLRSLSTPSGAYHAERATLSVGLIVGLAVLEGDPVGVVPAVAVGAFAVAPAVIADRRTS